jgi:hypothetical protein
MGGGDLMLNVSYRTLFALIFVIAAGASPGYAEMSSPNYKMLIVMDNAGETKSSDGYSLLDSVGQSTPIGSSTSPGYQLEAGFISTTVFTQSISEVLTGTTTALVDIEAELTVLRDLATGADKVSLRQQINKIDGALADMQRALDSFALYEGGDLGKLMTALNQSRQAIKDLEAFQAITETDIDTVPYQKMLAQASELNVLAEINRIAVNVGETDPNIVSARSRFAAGSSELLAGSYRDSVNTFKQAFADALNA